MVSVACGAGFGYAVGDVGLVEMERNVERDAEVFDEVLVGVGFFAAEAVMDVDGGEADAEGSRRVLAAWRVRRRATESAPPEMATQRRSPGWICVRSKGRVGGISPMLVGWMDQSCRTGPLRVGRPLRGLYILSW